MWLRDMMDIEKSFYISLIGVLEKENKERGNIGRNYI